MTDETEGPYRQGNHQKQNVYRGDEYIGVMFDPVNAALIVKVLNDVFNEANAKAAEEEEKTQTQICVQCRFMGKDFKVVRDRVPGMPYNDPRMVEHLKAEHNWF